MWNMTKRNLGLPTNMVIFKNLGAVKNGLNFFYSTTLSSCLRKDQKAESGQ